MAEFPIKQFRLNHGYTFDHPLRGNLLATNNLLVGGVNEVGNQEAFFLGKLAEYDNMKSNVWIDLQGAHAIYVMGKRRSGKSFTLGVLAESLASSQWIKQGVQKQAILVLDTMNVFLTMPHSVESVFGSKSPEFRELEQWGLKAENLPIKLFYPRGTDAPPEGITSELALKASDLTGEDWAALFGVDTYSEPTGQLISELYDKVALEGYTNGQSKTIPPNPNYLVTDLILCLDNNPDIQRFEPKTIEAVRRRLRAINRLPVFSEKGLSIRELFVEGQISVVLLRDLDYNLRGLIIGTIIKNIMEERSFSDRYERFAEMYKSKYNVLSAENSKEAPKALEKYTEYSNEAKKGLPRGWIIIDEAHNYLPSKGFVASREPLKKYVNEGRNLGLSIVVATQQPSGLDPAIQRNADILIIHSMSMSDDIQTAERMVNTFVPESVVVDNREQITTRVFEQVIRSLGLGFAIISNDRMTRVFPVKVRPRITVHGGMKY